MKKKKKKLSHIHDAVNNPICTSDKGQDNRIQTKIIVKS